ncbi:multidrug ABC transporter ATP-binding protein [Bacillus coahuilensis p1.1.43]|uniref:Multidrug ABC transporter ATP-binding protein n=2 Tax=Bacillus coahuilensis TaxID=408580 RepID=A0A147KBH8_9BACI|nr:ABC transporter ATP-binding protein [Bacillus coahuilensis]KUP08520.1 multidrug ABC transporter ATP-binding protein [Bacillus coahuilensis p1.1.43]
MIDVQQVHYGYNHSTVLTNLSLKESEPVITALWGRNGAGKTTLMSLLAGHQRPDRGTIFIKGEEPYNNLHAQNHLCYIQENHPFSKNWTVRDLLKFGNYFHQNWNQELADELVEVFELPTKKKITKFSKGMKTAAQIILGLASNASVTILDEPTNGLDAVKRKHFYDALITSYENNPRLILLSTHHIEEIQPICESLIVIHDGKVRIHQTMEEVRERGILLTGSTEGIQSATENVNIIESSKIGSISKVMVDEKHSKEWKDIASAHQLSIENASLQDYLINITNKKEVE